MAESSFSAVGSLFSDSLLVCNIPFTFENHPFTARIFCRMALYPSAFSLAAQFLRTQKAGTSRL